MAGTEGEAYTYRHDIGSQGEFGEVLARARNRMAQAHAIHKLMKQGMTAEQAMAEVGTDNTNLVFKSNRRKLAAWLASVEEYAQDYLGAEWWDEFGADTEAVGMLHAATFCWDDEDRAVLRERRKTLRWDEARDCPVGPNGPHRQYTDAERKYYELAYAQMAASLPPEDNSVHFIRRQHWNNFLRDRVREELADKYDPQTGEGLAPAELAELLLDHEIYFLANGFTWSAVWREAERLAMEDSNAGGN